MAPGRRRAAAAALVLLVLAGGWAVRQGLGTCEWLDRWLERSGCIAKAWISDFEPLPFATMLPAGEGRMRFFGDRPDAPDAPQRGRAVQLVFDLGENREIERADLFIGHAPFLVKPTADGGRVFVTCLEGVLCDRLRPNAAILSAETGAVVQTIETQGQAWASPGEPVVRNEDALLPDGRTVVWPDTATGGLALGTAGGDRSAAATIPPADPRPIGLYDPTALAARAAPDGRSAALIVDERGENGGSRIEVFDLAGRAHLATLRTDAGHSIRTSAAWTADGRHLVAVGRGGENSGGVPLYVFRLR